MSGFFWGGSWWEDALFVGAWMLGGVVVLAVIALCSLTRPGGYQPRRPADPNARPPCSVLSMQSPLRADGYCAGQHPLVGRKEA